MALYSCSQWARAQCLDPAGTAGYYRGFLLVEHPLPWPKDASAVPELAEVSRLAAEAGFRFQLLWPAHQPEKAGPDVAALSAGGLSSRPGVPVKTPVAGPWSTDGYPQGSEAVTYASSEVDRARRVICYRQVRAGWAGQLLRSERLVPASEVARAAAELLDDAAMQLDRGQGARRGTEPQLGASSAATVADVLVCAHGQRDICCGRAGTRLFAELVERPLPARAGVVRTWRTTHTGGHRFAPTAIVLPSATLWAYVDRALLESVLGAAGPVASAAKRYRGCATLGGPAQQALERAVLARTGWALLSAPRRALEAGEGLVRLETEGFGDWEAAVREGRRVPQPECRSSPASATKYSTEWLVEGLRKVG